MERGRNLEALAEEEDEETYANQDSDSESDSGFRKNEPNKFDALCDGVLSTLAIVHAGLQEFLEVKDEMMKHNLPPSVLTKLAINSTKVFRSITDMHMPVNELVRLVRIYSTPWEEKSTALKKLHDDYGAKKTQLNIAIKRLQLVDTQSKRLAREKRIMNWEKLFCRMTTTQGHGRRWKFLIDGFKQKAAQGVESLQYYLDEMERASESEDEEADDEDYQLETQIQQLAPSEDAITDPISDKEETESELESEEDSEEEMEPVLPEPKQEVVEVPTYVRPPMTDQQTWTHEPRFEHFLVVRVFKPEGLGQRELKCSLKLGDESHKTDILDPPPEEDEDKKNNETSAEGGSGARKESPPVKVTGRRGLMGTRGGTTGPGGVTTNTSASSLPTQDSTPKIKSSPKYEECVFYVPEGMLTAGKTDSQMPNNLRVAVHSGPTEDMVAMATIDMEDLDSLDLPVVVLASEVGDNFEDPESVNNISSSPSDTGQLSTILERDSVEELESSHSGSSRQAARKRSSARHSSADSVRSSLTDKLKELHPVNFPLYSIVVGRSDSVHEPCGQLPLVCFWGRQEIPRTVNRMTEADSVSDIVYDLTGFDLNVVSKDDLHKDTMERSVSAMSAPVEEQDKEEEMVPRLEYDRLMNLHRDEMEVLQEEYETRLQDLADSLQEMQEHVQLQVPGSAGQRSYRGSSATGERARSTEYVPRPPPKSGNLPAEGEPQTRRPRLGRTLPAWGENLPKNFFERLQLFKELSDKHKQELSERLSRETSDNLQKKLAGEYKLGPAADADAMLVSMQDVSLPAVFLPSKTGRDLTIYNPRASKYFHASGSAGVRLTQPPSMVQLPPLPKNKLAVVDLFGMSQNFSSKGGGDWLMQRYIEQQTVDEQQKQQLQEQQLQRMSTAGTSPQATLSQFEPLTPAPMYYGHEPLTSRDSARVLAGAPASEQMME